MQPDLELEYGERALLASITPMEGYKIFHRLMRAEVDKFVVSLLNADAANDSEVVARHRLAKAAAQFYQAITNRVNEEVTLYTAAPRPDDKPCDITEGVIDIGEIAERMDGMPVLLGGDEFD